MIGRLSGQLIQKQPPELLIDVNGVGYEVSAPMSTFYVLPELGEIISLHTHLVVREDAQLLYGFATESERRLFRILIKINGVGPKLAITILSGIAADDFIRCIHDGDSAALVRLPGIGKKTAERLIVELNDKVAAEDESISAAGTAGMMANLPLQSPVADAVSALISLGYKPNDASKMVRSIETEGLNAEEIIRLSLQGLSK
ncbi:MAG: Holliday junction branch migration protein RuvA [Gammaproteobacteria bacterium]|nr:Holliday junction branch migration protein RuvA [Gammaproteobacteria bacterium]